MANVFISSTGKDLTDYRQAAIEVCLRLGLTPVAMEFFEAMGIGATEGSKAKLDGAEVYVGIGAQRYGLHRGQPQQMWCPKSNSITPVRSDSKRLGSRA